jgi:hypothetical protein
MRGVASNAAGKNSVGKASMQDMTSPQLLMSICVLESEFLPAKTC